jgi:hypothetical protein
MEHLILRTFIRTNLARLDFIAIQIGSSRPLRNALHRNAFENRNHYSSDSSIGSGGRNKDGNRRLPRSAMLGQTEVFMQSGLKISELPLVVKKVNDVLQLGIATKRKPLSTADTGAATIYVSKSDAIKVKAAQEVSITSEESREIIAGLRRCFSVGGLFRLLETIPAEEVTPAVAVAALKLIINLDNHPLSTTIPFHRQSLRGNRKVASIASLTSKISNGDTRMSETFLRYAFINMLLEIIYRSRDPIAIIEGKQ